MAPPRRWIRIDVGWSRSDWLAELSPAARLAWIELLTYCKAEGVRGEVKAVSPAVFGRMCGIPTEDVAAMLDAAQRDGALVIEDRAWKITNWDAYQEPDATAAERKRRQRDRIRRESGDNTAVTPEVTVCHGSHGVTSVTGGVTRRATETETETETEASSTPPMETVAKATEAAPRAAQPQGGSAQAAVEQPEGNQRQQPETQPAGRKEPNIGAVLAPLIREHLWLGDSPPSQGWTMDREISVARQLMEKYYATVDELAEAIRITRSVLDDELPPGRPTTLRFFLVRERKDRLNVVLHFVRQRFAARRYQEEQRRQEGGPVRISEVFRAIGYTASA